MICRSSRRQWGSHKRILNNSRPGIDPCGAPYSMSFQQLSNFRHTLRLPLAAVLIVQAVKGISVRAPCPLWFILLVGSRAALPVVSVLDMVCGCDLRLGAWPGFVLLVGSSASGIAAFAICGRGLGVLASPSGVYYAGKLQCV